MNIQLLLTGNELMNGDITDTNSVMIANRLSDFGLTIQRKVTVGDDPILLIDEIKRLSETADILIMNGGLGPTVDDLTAEALAKVVEKPLVENKQALEHLEFWSQTRGLVLNAANLKQAQLPDGVDILPNPVGTAVGFTMIHNDCQIFCTPGVPSELKVMLDESILPALQQQASNVEPYLLKKFHLFGQGESNLQQWISNKLPNWPEEVELGFRADSPTLEVKVRTPKNHQQIHDQTVEQVVNLIGDYIVAEDSSSLEKALVKLLDDNNAKLTTAESCTGGLIASMITSVAGSSNVFEAGYVTYSNDIKSQLLGVKENTLVQHGAVSRDVVLEMAQGALDSSNADYTIAVSGIAGPGGGSDEKPVGTVWIAWGDKQGLNAVSLYYPFSRRRFQVYVAGAALDLIRRHILNIQTEPRYLKDRQVKAQKKQEKNI